MKLLATLVILVGLAACKKDAAPTAPGPVDEPVATDPYACTADDDCVAVEIGCCDECNGGEAVGVHEDHADAVLADSPPGRGECEGTGCTKRGCAEWVPSCQAGQCEISRGSLE